MSGKKKTTATRVSWMSETTAILLCGHGSRDEEALRDFVLLVERVRNRLPGRCVAHGYLEFAQPTIPQALDNLRQREIRAVCAVPVMLTAAAHIKRDLPEIFADFRARHADMTIHVASELGLDDRVRAAGEARIRAALDEHHCRDNHDCVLMVVGRGAAEANVIAQVRELTGTLCAAFGFAGSVTCYCGIAEPRVAAGLEQAAGLGHKNIIVFPFLLFSGVLLNGIHQCVAATRTLHPDLCFIEAECLRSHPFLIEAIVERVRQCRNERNADER